jgi:3-hydroxyisobutyrate dehydrogenase-like beta-hydroxyacid dehydrogenase
MNAASPAQVRLGIYGYGEIGHAIALGLAQMGLRSIVALQRAPLSPLARERMALSGVDIADSPAELAAGADLIIAATQGAHALAAGKAIAPCLEAHHLSVDLASASPQVKVEIAAALAQSGSAVADGIIEESPLTAGHRISIVASGPAARRFHDLMSPWGMRIAVAGDQVGRASALKCLRQIMTKGHMALLIECFTAASRYGLKDEVFASTAQWFNAGSFEELAERVVVSTTVHATRRAEEAGMAVEMLREMGIAPLMSSAAQQVLGKVAQLDLRSRLGGHSPPNMAAALELMRGYADG